MLDEGLVTLGDPSRVGLTGREPACVGPGTYVFPEDEGQDGSRELCQEDDQDEQEELQREGRTRESRGQAAREASLTDAPFCLLHN